MLIRTLKDVALLLPVAKLDDAITELEAALLSAVTRLDEITTELDTALLSAVAVRVDSDTALLFPVARLADAMTDTDTALLSATEVSPTTLSAALRVDEIFVELEPPVLSAALAPVLAPALAPAESPADVAALPPAALSIFESTIDSAFLNAFNIKHLLKIRKPGVSPEFLVGISS